MKNKFVLTEEESKRILSLHKKKIQEERNQITETEQDLDEVSDTGQSVGRVAAGGGTGAAAGAIIGCIATAIPTGGLACPAGAAIGASIGTAVGAMVGSFTTGGGYYERVFNILKWCNTNGKKVGRTVNSDETIRNISDTITSAVEGVRTDEMMIANSIKRLKSIPDLCRLNRIYRERNNESLLQALDGDFDMDTEWRDFVWRPIEELKNYSIKKSKDLLEKTAKDCGYSSVDEYKKSGWKCPKEGTVTDDTKLKKAKRCGYNSWEEYKKANWKCKTQDQDDDGQDDGTRPIRRVRYGFNYQEALKAIKTKCPAGGGGEQGQDGFADDWRSVTDKEEKLDTTVSQDKLQSWAS